MSENTKKAQNCGKFEKLIELLRSLENVAVAFSGGVDSTFLLKAAREALGDNVTALTAASSAFTESEMKEAAAFCEAEGIRHIVIRTNELGLEGFGMNPPDRCYICKKEIFSQFKKTAGYEGIANVAEGSNVDDEGDYRPGMKAVQELGIISPLRIAGYTKKEIREESKRLGLPTWDKPSMACLYSRFPYGEKISAEKLGMVENAERYLKDLGFSQLRVRIHGKLARIELAPEDIERFVTGVDREVLYKEFKKLGFSYVTLDISGYRTGSMNETLPDMNKK